MNLLENYNNPKIGVLGGIGPESTAEFYTKIIYEFQKRGLIKSNKDFPQIIINSIPAQELVYENITDADLSLYITGLKELEDFGVNFIVMVCNTIHLFYDKLQAQIKTPILDLRKEVEKAVKIKGVRSVLILGTPSTINKGLYDFDSINSIKPTKNDIELLSTAISNFNNGTEKEKQRMKVTEICNKYLSKNDTSTVILGCTEFGLMLSNENFDKINTIDVLVKATVDKAVSFK
jgi:aspartate racemase